VNVTATPWIIGRSCWTVDCTASPPSPGIANTDSTSTVPVSMPTNTSPMTVTTGIAALRSACRNTIDRSDAPLARRLCTKSRPSASSMPSLVCLAITAAGASASAITGSTMLCAQPDSDVAGSTYPVAGSSRNATANTVTSTSPNQNTGTANPTSDSASTSRPSAPPRTALTTPSVTPTSAASTVHHTISDSVTPSRVVICSPTSRPLMGETPRSPCSAPLSQCQYWVSSGSSSPSCWRSWA